MIKIKAVDEENILDVCELKTGQDDIRKSVEEYSYCNAVSIAEAKYHAEMYPAAIYNNNVLIGFFMYLRTENQADTATIFCFMLDDRFKQKGLEEKAFKHILRGLKIQGVKSVIFVINPINERIKNLCLSCGFHLAEKNDNEYCYKLEW